MTTISIPLISCDNAIRAKNRSKHLHTGLAQPRKSNKRRLTTTTPGSSFLVINHNRKIGRRRSISCNSFKSTRSRNVIVCSKALLTSDSAVDDHDKDDNDTVVYTETYPVTGVKQVTGKIYTRIDQGKKDDQWQLTVGCTLPGEWVMHWGVHYIGDRGREWDQPPHWMRPVGSVAVKDYAIETPLQQVVEPDGNCIHEVKIDFYSNCAIADIKFLLKDVETGSWYRSNDNDKDFCIPFTDYLCEDGNVDMSAWNNFSLWLGVLSKLPHIIPKGEDSKSLNDHQESTEKLQPNKRTVGFYDEQDVVKNISLEFSVTVVVRKCPNKGKNTVYMETSLSEDVTIHWGVCNDDRRIWEIPPAPYPLDAEVFKDRALRTKLKPKEGGHGRVGNFAFDEHIVGFLYVIKLDGDTWLKCNGQDFFVPLPPATRISVQSESDFLQGVKEHQSSGGSESRQIPEKPQVQKQEDSQPAHSAGIINNIRNVVTDLYSEKSWKNRSIEARAILHEIERLGATAYGMFRSSITFSGEAEDSEPGEQMKPSSKLTSGTGSGHEILCQGFNWESHRSGRWYMELEQKAEELSSLGFTIIWLPPPTESVSPEGYMPKDYYNLNSRYGNMDQLKAAINKFHQVGMKVLGDAVLNHRCAHSQNANGVWNKFGGRLAWGENAVVADDPHFQGKGNKSSGDNFHAAPNIDHSQDFVRKDLEEWLCWLRKDIGYDGWRLDFVRGFWGGYVKDYIKASEPYFAVGEFWDSLSYTYHVMDYNQDAHRQRIIEWIEATGGTAGAFDVTTKGVLHTVLERCEYWRLSDAYGKPPGVLGWWSSRAVTFIENHDTGSTQGHWRFPEGKEMQGYAYILTHPGTPTVFYDHIFSHYRSEIAALIAIRNRKKIHCRSSISIMKAGKDVYAAKIDDKLAMKIGPGYYEPPSEQTWSLALEGNCYKVWETS